MPARVNAFPIVFPIIMSMVFAGLALVMLAAGIRISNRNVAHVAHIAKLEAELQQCRDEDPWKGSETVSLLDADGNATPFVLVVDGTAVAIGESGSEVSK